MTRLCAIGVAVALAVAPRVVYADPPPPAWYIFEGSLATACAGLGAYFALRPGTTAEKDHDDAMTAAFLISGGLIASTMLTVWLTTDTKVSIGPKDAVLVTTF